MIQKGECPKSIIVFTVKKSNFPGLSHILLLRCLLKVSDNATKSIAVWTTDAW